jgi:hypothetical protein
MQLRFLNRRRRELVTGILLVALVLRALIPVGFMPSAGAPFSLEICHAGLPKAVLAHHHSGQHQPGSETHFDHCTFGSAPAVGPLAHVPGIAAIPTPVFYLIPVAESERAGTHLLRAQQARAPPPAPFA